MYIAGCEIEGAFEQALSRMSQSSLPEPSLWYNAQVADTRHGMHLVNTTLLNTHIDVPHTLSSDMIYIKIERSRSSNNT